METTLFASLVTAADRTEYELNGSVQIRNVLSVDAVASFVEELERLLVRYDRTQRIGATAVFVRQAGSVFFEFLTRDIPFFARFLLESPIASVVGQLLGLDEVQVWRDEVHFKEADCGSNATPWHHGIASSPFKGEHTPTVWLAMSDVTEETSPLQTIAGSHRHQAIRYRPPTRRGHSSLIEGYRDIPDIDALVASGHYRVQTWTAKAGDAVIFHPYTVHGAPANKAVVRRIAYVTRWLGADAIWQPDAYSTVDPALDPSRMIVDGRASREHFPPFSVVRPGPPATAGPT